MKLSYFKIILIFIRDCLLLPFVYFTNVVGHLYAYEKESDSSLSIFGYFLTVVIANIFTPILNLTIQLYKKHSKSSDDSHIIESPDTKLSRYHQISQEEILRSSSPSLEDYGISHLDIRKLDSFKSKLRKIFYLTFIIPSITTTWIVFSANFVSDTGQLAFLLLSAWFVLVILIPILSRILAHENYKEVWVSMIINGHKPFSKINQALNTYNEDLKTFKTRRVAVENEIMRRSWEFWFAKDGLELEDATASLFRDLGYHVRKTPPSGDRGIDLYLSKDEAITIVQCKSYKKKVGPKPMRELLGALVDSNANSAIIVAPRGFTDEARKYVSDKPIEAWDVNDLTKASFNYVSYTDYELAQAKTITDVQKYIKSKTGINIRTR